MVDAYTSRFSATVKAENSRVAWKVRAKPYLARRDAEEFVMSWPPMVTDPLVGRWKPLRTFKRVVLPAPFGPISPKISPGDTSSDTASSATISPKRTVTARAERASAFGGALDAAETRLVSLKDVTVDSGVGA
jgi:hypothetical protein